MNLRDAQKKLLSPDTKTKTWKFVVSDRDLNTDLIPAKKKNSLFLHMTMRLRISICQFQAFLTSKSSKFKRKTFLQAVFIK